MLCPVRLWPKVTATAFLILHTGRSHTQGSCADGYLVVEPGWDGGAALPDAQEARCAVLLSVSVVLGCFE